MSRLKQLGKAFFYWDYDNSYIRTGELNSAGYFIRKNLSLFGNDMPSDWNYYTMLSQNSEKVIRRVIETSSDIAQVKLISGLIKELPGLTRENAHQTAVILADENLLVPVLTSLPSDIKDVNITMGYPLKETPVYSLIKSLFDLQNNARSGNNKNYFAFRDVLKILGNNLVSGLLDGCEDKIIREINERNLVYVPSDYFQNSDILTEVFIKPSTPSLLSRYLKSILLLIAQKDYSIEPDSEVIPKSLRNEFIYRAILSINRLEIIAEDPK